MGRLSGKRALVAGAGGKLGGDLARAFAREGADLVLTTRTAAKLAPLVSDVQALGVRAVAVAADFTVREEVVRLAEAAWDAFGGLDVALLSSQPGEPGMGSLLETRDADWEEQQAAIVSGPFRLLRALAPKWIAAGTGASVITLVSSTGEEPIPGYGAYGLAKGGLWLLSRYMAAEWGQYGIRVNSISPGLIATGGSGAADADAPPAAMVARTALRRLGRNSEVVGAAVYLASDEASFTTGQCIRVNGGRV